DVDRESLQRRDVDDATAPGGPLDQRVDRREERRERLAGSGRRHEERVLAGADGRPGAVLRRRRRFKGRAEPLADGRMELLERSTPHALRLLAHECLDRYRDNTTSPSHSNRVSGTPPN